MRISKRTCGAKISAFLGVANKRRGVVSVKHKEWEEKENPGPSQQRHGVALSAQDRDVADAIGVI